MVSSEKTEVGVWGTGLIFTKVGEIIWDLSYDSELRSRLYF